MHAYHFEMGAIDIIFQFLTSSAYTYRSIYNYFTIFIIWLLNYKIELFTVYAMDKLT